MKHSWETRRYELWPILNVVLGFTLCPFCKRGRGARGDLSVEINTGRLRMCLDNVRGHWRVIVYG